MPYKISGTKNETSRIIIIDETDYSIEKTVLIEGSGEYEIDVTEGKKTILARLNTGETVGYGDVDAIKTLGALISDGEVFNSGATNSPSVTKLTDTKAIVCYRGTGSNYYGTACVLNISDSAITAGDQHVFCNKRIENASVTRLTDTKAIVCYKDFNNNNRGTARVLNISGSTISAGSEKVFNNASTTNISVTALTGTKAVVCYTDSDNSDYGTARVLNISDSTITIGDEYVFNNASTTNISVTALTDTKAVVCFKNNSNNRGTARVLNISDSTITIGDEYVFNNGYIRYTSVVKLTSTKAIVCYQDFYNNRYGTTCVLGISGSTITSADKYVFNNSGRTDYIAVTALTDTKAVVCYSDYDGGSYYGTARILNISGSTITAGDEYIFYNTNPNYISTIGLTDEEAVVCCYGTAKLIYNL